MKHSTKVYACKHCGNDFPFRGYSYTHNYCSNECSAAYRAAHVNAKKRASWLKGKLEDNSGNRARIYGWLVELKGNVCAVCNEPGMHNGKPLRLWVDHIDGNSSNNHPDNFRLVCPNCESQSETFAGKNRGHGRKKHTGSYFN